MITVNYDPAFIQSDADCHLDDGPSEEEERQSALDVCLEQLNEQQKVCVKLFYYEGHSYKEIAIMRNEEVGRIRSNIQNGRRNLKNCIEGQEQRNE